MVGDVEAVEAWVEVSGSVDRIARLRNGKTRVGVPGAGMAHRGGAYMAHTQSDMARKTSGIDWCGAGGDDATGSGVRLLRRCGIMPQRAEYR